MFEKDDITVRQPTYIYHISLLDIPSKEKQLTMVSKKRCHNRRDFEHGSLKFQDYFDPVPVTKITIHYPDLYKRSLKESYDN